MFPGAPADARQQPRQRQVKPCQPVWPPPLIAVQYRVPPAFGVQSMFPDVPIVLQAVALTFGTFFALLLAYTSGLIKPTENFKLGLVAATGGIFMAYMLSFVLGLFGVERALFHRAYQSVHMSRLIQTA